MKPTAPLMMKIVLLSYVSSESIVTYLLDYDACCMTAFTIIPHNLRRMQAARSTDKSAH